MSRIDLSLSTASGKWLCLLFANTLENYRIPEQLDEMPNYQSWVGWSLHHGLISREASEGLIQWGAANSTEAEEAWSKADGLRLEIFRLLSARAAGAIPTQRQLEFLNRLLPGSLTPLRIGASHEELFWQWQEDERPDRMIWPIVHSTAQLLTDPQCLKLRQCGGNKCTWLFIDQSRNASRRWCDMKVCGNRAKSRRHYQKSRDAAS